jgi:uncharacterized lipoprotein YmbA
MTLRDPINSTIVAAALRVSQEKARRIMLKEMGAQQIGRGLFVDRAALADYLKAQGAAIRTAQRTLVAGAP